MASKLLIPCYNGRGDLIRIRFRLDVPGPDKRRYRISRGSNPGLPYPIGMSKAKPVMIVESELDAILLAQQAGAHVGLLALGTTGIKLNPAMIRIKLPASLRSDRGWRNASEQSGAMLRNRMAGWPGTEWRFHRNRHQRLFTHIEIWLKTGVIAPKTTSLLERIFREIGRRLKRIAWGWSDTAVTKLSKMIILKKYSKEKWEQYWKQKLGIEGNFSIRISGIETCPCQHF